MSKMAEVLKRVFERKIHKKHQPVEIPDKEECEKAEEISDIGVLPEIVDACSEATLGLQLPGETLKQIAEPECKGKLPYRRAGCNKCSELNECIKCKVSSDFNKHFRWYIRIGGYR